MISGIYMIENVVNGKCYIGSATNINKRFSQHKSDLKNNRHINIHLQRSYNKHGENCFKYEILEHCHISEVLIREQLYLNIAKTESQKFYNATFIAGGGNLGEEIQIKKGITRKLKQYSKGKNNPTYINKKYHFFNEKLKLNEYCTPFELRSKYNLDQGQLSNVINKKFQCKSIKGWIIK